MSKQLIPKAIEAKNEMQKRVLSSQKNTIVHGSAGTGKTFLLIYRGLNMLRRGKVDKLIILRSAVATREVGFLPGDYEDKISVYQQPYKQIFFDLYDDKAAYKKVRGLEFDSTSFVRGITLENAYVIIDEIQNLNFHELDSIMTRAGENCILNFTGDLSSQSDLFQGQKNLELQKFFNIVSKLPSFDVIQFTPEHVVRSGMVKEYLLAKEKYEQGSPDK